MRPSQHQTLNEMNHITASGCYRTAKENNFDHVACCSGDQNGKGQRRKPATAKTEDRNKTRFLRLSLHETYGSWTATLRRAEIASPSKRREKVNRVHPSPVLVVRVCTHVFEREEPSPRDSTRETKV
mmetsp:Transcript_24536/g.67939  ORF Transcript_24536/g.67939 Transcript_24536/m.67939 type:complete len:127 (-) Transcript_24536:226-606(-)